jgi:hypothetical protein
VCEYWLYLTWFGPMWLSYAHETKDFTEISFYHQMESWIIWQLYWKNFKKTISKYGETECMYKATSWLWSHSVKVRICVEDQNMNTSKLFKFSWDSNTWNRWKYEYLKFTFTEGQNVYILSEHKYFEGALFSLKISENIFFIYFLLVWLFNCQTLWYYELLNTWHSFV